MLGSMDEGTEVEMRDSALLNLWPTSVYTGDVRWKKEIEELMEPYLTEEYEHTLSRGWGMSDAQASIFWEKQNEEDVPFPWDQIMKYLTSSVEDYFSKLGAHRSLQWKFGDLWLNKYEHKEWQEPHRHIASATKGPADCFSFSYTLKKPSGGRSRGGELVFERDGHSYHEERLGQLFQAYANYARVSMLPDEGQIFIFPEHLLHWVSPNLSEDEPRYSISGNILISNGKNND